MIEPSTPGPASSEAAISLPGGLLVATVLGVAGLIGAGWIGVAWLAHCDWSVQLAGPVAAAAVGGIAALSVLVMTPWKTRTISWWMTFWLAGMVARVLLTSIAAFLLYSATPLNPEALALAVGFTYLVVLLAEAAVLARFVGRVVYPSRSDSRLKPGVPAKP